MLQIQTHRRADNTRLGFKPGDARPKPMNFKANKCPDSQTDMVTLRDFEPVLTSFNTRELFEATMVDLNLPGIQCMEGGLLNGHVQAASCPVFRVAVCADRPKNLDPAIPFEVNQTSCNFNEYLSYRTAPATVYSYPPCSLDLSHPFPFQA